MSSINNHMQPFFNEELLPLEEQENFQAYRVFFAREMGEQMQEQIKKQVAENTAAAINAIKEKYLIENIALKKELIVSQTEVVKEKNEVIKLIKEIVSLRMEIVQLTFDKEKQIQ